MRLLVAGSLALLVLAAALPTQGGMVHAPMLPWADLLDEQQPCSSLEVGAGARAFTPATNGVPWQEPFEDTNGNAYYDAPNPLAPDAHSDPYTDSNGNGKWDGPWMAGYGHDAPNGPNKYYYATSVHDDVWARALALRCGNLTLGLVSLDAVGLFVHEVQAIRDAAAGFDHIIVASTHTHDSVDTMGLWGPNELTDGKDPRTLAHLRNQTVLALADALAALQPVSARFAAAKAPNDFSTGSIDFGFLQSDLRDPIVLDDTIVSAQFLALDGSTVATLVNWSPHPETLCGDVGEISSDYVHYLRQGIEQGGFVVKGQPQQGFGGTAVFFSGAVGGMMTTLRARVLDEQGKLLPQCSYAKAQRIGELAAWTAMNALRAAPPSGVDALRVQARQVDVPIDNPFLVALNTIGLFGHPANLGPVQSSAVTPRNLVLPLPYLRTEVDVLTFGGGASPAAQILTVPGELLPEVFLGGELEPLAISDTSECYRLNPLKQKFSGGTGLERFVAANPDIPQEPIIRDHARAQHVFLFGLANDELGYVVPANDFTPPSVYPVFADGTDRCGDSDHYEETVSASSVLAPILAQNLTMLLDPSYQPPAQPLMPLGLRPRDGMPAGVWVDTSGSGAFEDREDTQVYLGSLQGLPMRFGFLDSRGRDLGSDPLALAGKDPRGVWLDTNGTGQYEPGGDGVVFADVWLLGDDALADTF